MPLLLSRHGRARRVVRPGAAQVGVHAGRAADGLRVFSGAGGTGSADGELEVLMHLGAGSQWQVDTPVPDHAPHPGAAETEPEPDQSFDADRLRQVER